MIPTIKGVMESLGYFRPRKLESMHLDSRMGVFLRRHGWSISETDETYWSIREPGEHSFALAENRMERPHGRDRYPDWHQDGCGAKVEFWMALWSNIKPTEIWHRGKIYIPEPCEVIVFQNAKCWHRAQVDSRDDRWFIRVSDIERRG